MTTPRQAFDKRGYHPGDSPIGPRVLEIGCDMQNAHEHTSLAPAEEHKQDPGRREYILALGALPDAFLYDDWPMTEMPDRSFPRAWDLR